MRKFPKTITVTVDADVCLDEFETKDLIEELDRRRGHERIETLQTGFSSKESMLKYIKSVVGLKKWHDNERLIQEIRDLF